MGGPKPIRGTEGKERYQLKHYAGGTPLSKKDVDKLKLHNLVSIRVAHILALCWEQRIPCGFETPECCLNQVSMLDLDEYAVLLKKDVVKHIVGVQCPFGAATRSQRHGSTMTWTSATCRTHDRTEAGAVRCDADAFRNYHGV